MIGDAHNVVVRAAASSARRVLDEEGRVHGMQVNELAAREAIRDLVARYNLYGDSGRLDEMLTLFTDDGVLQYSDGHGRLESYSGQVQIRQFVEQTKQRWAEEAAAGRASPYVRHHVSTHVIDVLDPDRATGRAYVLVLRASGLAEWGRYFDDYRRVDRRWLFARRVARRDEIAPS